MDALLKVFFVMALTISGEYYAIRTAQLNALLLFDFVSFCPVLRFRLQKFQLTAARRGGTLLPHQTSQIKLPPRERPFLLSPVSETPVRTVVFAASGLPHS